MEAVVRLTDAFGRRWSDAAAIGEHCIDGEKGEASGPRASQKGHSRPLTFAGAIHRVGDDGTPKEVDGLFGGGRRRRRLRRVTAGANEGQRASKERRDE